VAPDDGRDVNPSPATGDGGAALLATYDRSLPHVYGYLLSRCGRQVLAEDLTAETFLAAVDAVRRDASAPVSTAWLIGIARHKLVDHWRRLEREERTLRAVEGTATDDPWDTQLDGLRARAVLEALAPQHRAALTLRYVDDLPVTEVAHALDRTEHATEALLVRARRAFRDRYTDSTGDTGEEDGDD